MRAYGCLALLLGLVNAAVAQPQTIPPFESVSIKTAPAGEHGIYVRVAPDGTVNVINMPVREMILLAWRVEPFQIYGGPDWLASSRYDISAKPDKSAKQNEVALLLQALITDRFQLKMHRERRQLPTFALVVPSKNAKLGRGLTPSKDGSCVAPDPNQPPHPPEPGKPSTLGCGGMMTGRNRLAASSIPVADLAKMLSKILRRTVVDKTGLSGKFDVNLQWTPTVSPDRSSGASKAPPPGFDGPVILAAVQDQLGLKLEAQTGQVDVFVIDHVEKPSEN